MMKRILKLLVALSLFLVILLSCMPMLISISQVNQFLISCVNNRIAGKLHADEIRVGWTDGISIKGLQIQDPQGRKVADFRKISCDVALLSLLHAPDIEGKITVDSPKVLLIDDQNNGHFSVEQVFASTKQDAIESKNPSQLTLTDLQLALDIQPQGQAKINFVCQVENTENNKTEKGSVTVTGTVQNVQELEKAYKGALGQPTSGAASVVALDCAIDRFPIKALVPFVRMKDPVAAAMLVPALGNTLNAKIAHTLRGDELGLHLLVATPELHAKLKGSIKGCTLTVKEEGTLSWNIRPELIPSQKKPTKLLASLQPFTGSLGRDGKIPLALSWQLDTPLTLKDGLAIALNGNITTQSLQEQVEAHTEVTLTRGDKTSACDFICKVDSPLTSPRLECNLAVQGPLLLPDLLGKDPKVELTAKAERQDNAIRVTTDATVGPMVKLHAVTPITWQDDGITLTTEEGKITSSAFVATIDQLTVQTGKESKKLVVALSGDDLQLKANLQYTDKLVAKEPIQAAYTVTKDRFSLLQKLLKSDKKMELKAPVKLALQVKELEFATLDACSLNAKISIDECSFMQKDAKNLTIAPLTTTIELSGVDKLVTFRSETAASQDKTAAQIAITGKAENLWNSSGLQLDQAHIIIDTKIQNLPLDILYSFTPAHQAEQVVAALGPKMDATLKGDVKSLTQGSFKGTIATPRLESNVSCLLQDGTLTLEKPITAEYTLTPEAGKVLLKGVNPLLVTAAKTERPIKLQIDSNGFSIPLKPFSMQGINIKNITLDPGILTCKNGGMLSLLVNLLKIKPTTSGDISLWFTPMYVEVKNGVVHCKRTDILMADAYPLATWGKIDLVKNSIDMTLGLSGQAISRAFDIGRLDPNYMVQIPIQGTTQSPKIDSTLATTKITALKLQQTKSNTTSIIGGLLEAATTIVEKDAPVPPPTTQPLPWAKRR